MRASAAARSRAIRRAQAGPVLRSSAGKTETLSGACAYPPWMLNRRQRTAEIGLEVDRILEPDRQPHHPVPDALLGANFGRQALMRRGCRMGGKALGIAEVVG